VFIDLRAERILSRPVILGLAVVLLRGDSTVQFVFVHRIETALKPVAVALPRLDRLLAHPFFMVSRAFRFLADPRQALGLLSFSGSR
jgi:hypothetical protein